MTTRSLLLLKKLKIKPAFSDIDIVTIELLRRTTFVMEDSDPSVEESTPPGAALLLKKKCFPEYI
jgi:hypothetical protein